MSPPLPSSTSACPRSLSTRRFFPSKLELFTPAAGSGPGGSVGIVGLSFRGEGGYMRLGREREGVGHRLTVPGLFDEQYQVIAQRCWGIGLTVVGRRVHYEGCCFLLADPADVLKRRRKGEEGGREEEEEEEEE
eukprot:3884369-Rhodomonas_salina.1